MGPGKLFWKVFLGNALLVAGVLGACVWLIVREVDHFHSAELTAYLRSQAETLHHVVGDRFDLAHAPELNRFVRGLGLGSIESRGIRLTLILADGRVLADSDANPEQMESHLNRPEVQQALSMGWGEDVRMSRTVLRAMKYVAVRVGPAHSPRGVVRTAMAIQTVRESTQAMRRLTWLTALAGLGAAILLALGLARLWSAPIRRVAQTARNLSHGDLTSRVYIRGTDELAALARALNTMRDHLAAHVETIDRQRRTLESLLAQLREGVVVAGPEGRIVLINPSAVRLLGLHAAEAAGAPAFQGKAVEECVSLHLLQRMLLSDARTAVTRDDSAGMGESESAIREQRLRIETASGAVSVLARATEIVLPGPPGGGARGGLAEGGGTGRLLVLTDITELDRMMQVRSDFAANASHELRTPISAIRGAVETLLDLDPTAEPDAVRQFVGMIDRHSRRVADMVSDLLDLSKIESAPDQFQPQTLNLRDLAGGLYARHAEALGNKRLAWEADLPCELPTMVANPYLIRMVLDNLVHNAIKFTDPGGHVRLTCRRVTCNGGAPPAVSLTVADDGCGIREEEQARVFERFYQVARARAGPDRGTGLGLSIVRHAVTAMDGIVALRSTLGHGTTVTVTIPQPA